SDISFYLAFFFSPYVDHPDLPSFPTRRSSDLIMNAVVALYVYSQLPEFVLRFVIYLLSHSMYRVQSHGLQHIPAEGAAVLVANQDRKSTRLNSSHVKISYAVFCLKKKKKKPRK